MAESNTQEYQPISRVAVVGGGLAGWTVAAMIAHRMRGQRMTVTLVDCKNNREPQYQCETTLPSVLGFTSVCGISERQLVAATGATYKLATCYDGWSDASQQYFMPFAEHGFMLNRRDFSGFAIRRQAESDRTPYDAYSLSAVAARNGRFRHTSEKANSLFSTLSYALHLDRPACEELLMMHAQSLGVQYCKGSITDVTRNLDDGRIDAVNLTEGSTEVIEADLFIDCTGTGRLIGDALDVDYLDDSRYLYADRSVSVLSRPVSLPPYTYLKPLTAGWQSRIVTQRACETRYHFNSSLHSDEQAVAELLEDHGRETTSEPVFHSLRPGRRAKAWYKNCIAMGLSAGELESFAVGNLHLVQSAVVRLMGLFPASTEHYFNAQEYNRLTELEFQHLLDFHALHYKISQTLDTEFWRECRAGEAPDSLRHKLELFSSRGLMPFYEGQTIPDCTWVSLLLGSGIQPKTYDPIVEGFDGNWIAEQLDKMKTVMAEAARSMPGHAEYLQRYCANSRKREIGI